MITSPTNEKLKLVRKLARRRDREREGLFLTEGEDLLEAGLAAGAEPQFVLVSSGSGLDGEEVDADLLDEVSALGSGTRVIAVWPESWADGPGERAIYLHGVGDPANVGAIVRSAHALVDASVVLGPETADPYSPKAVRASMGSVFAQPLIRGELEATPQPRGRLWSRTEARGWRRSPAQPRCASAPNGTVSPTEIVEGSDVVVTIPLRSGGAESLNVAAAAAIACERLSSPDPEAAQRA